jgi:hypothetical protein
VLLSQGIGLYDQIVESLISLGRKTKVSALLASARSPSAPQCSRVLGFLFSKAEELLLERLKDDPEPKYWCLLGDVHQGLP